MLVKGKKIFLRATSLSDKNILFLWENNKQNWEVSSTKKAFTESEIEGFIKNQKDIYLDKQLRLMISKLYSPHLDYSPGSAVGCIDLFKYNETLKEASVGILIAEKYRRNGYASEAIEILAAHCFQKIKLNELKCSISTSNLASLNLFKSNGFVITDTKNNIHQLCKKYVQ